MGFTMRSLQQHRPLIRLIRFLELFLPPLLIPEWIRKEQACKPRGTDLAIQTEHYNSVSYIFSQDGKTHQQPS